MGEEREASRDSTEIQQARFDFHHPSVPGAPFIRPSRLIVFHPP